MQSNILGFLTFWIYQKYNVKKIYMVEVLCGKYPVNENEIINQKYLFLSKKNNEEIASIYNSQFGIQLLRFYSIWRVGQTRYVDDEIMIAKMKNKILH